ncbi:MAG: hypothetical protein AABZ60_22225, partial [Planctomycetota bacterium]
MKSNTLSLKFSLIINKLCQSNSIFSKGLQVKSGALPYPVFVLSGLVLWYFVSSSLTNAANSMEMNAKIIKKIYFLLLIIPISAILTAEFDLIFRQMLVMNASQRNIKLKPFNKINLSAHPLFKEKQAI